MSKRKLGNSLVSTNPLSREEIGKLRCLVIQPDKQHKTHGNTKSLAWTHFGKLYFDEELDDEQTATTFATNSTSSVTGTGQRLKRKMIDPEHIYCQLCLKREMSLYDRDRGLGHISKVKKYSLTTSTTTMNDHLLNEHGIESKEVGKLQHTLEGCFSGGRSKSACKTAFEYNRDFVFWFCSDLLPFNTVEKEGFKRFFDKNGIREFPLPSRTTLSVEALQDVYILVKEKVRAKLKDVEVAAVMFDGWTDRFKALPFVGLRVGFIDPDWEYKVVTISIKIVPAHTGVALANHVTSELRQFGIGADVSLLSTHDGASNMRLCSRMMGVDNFIHCVAHSLHLLLVTDTMSKVPEVQVVLEKCKIIVQTLHFKGLLVRDEEAKAEDRKTMDNLLEAVAECQEVLDFDEQFGVEDEDRNEAVENDSSGHKHSTLKSAIPTRWNANLTMIQSIISIGEKTINAVLNRCGKHDCIITPLEKDLLVDLNKFLSPFNDLTKLVSERDALASLIPLIKSEIRSLCGLSPRDSTAVVALKRNVMKKLDARLPETEAVMVASLMDPDVKEVVDLPEQQKVSELCFSQLSMSTYVMVLWKAELTFIHNFGYKK